MAQQLGDRGVRSRMVASLKASTADDEHKVTLGQALAGLDGGARQALSTRVKASVRGAARNWSDLENELEVYMPVREHRASYTGSQPTLVAWQLLEDEAPIGYRSTGERVVL
jgi:hypothetical protein